MVKSGAQILEPAENPPTIQLLKKSETNFSLKSEAEEISIVEKFKDKLTDKLNVKLRFSRLKRRMRSRSSNIL